ncbi:AAA family ATPase [Caminibacter sp.]
MIKKIIMKNIATYDENGVEINDLKKVNFFFGHNGAGKSTIAKYLYNLSLELDKQDLRFVDCTQDGYDIEKHHILVFNEDFTKRNFIENKTLKGIFFLNEINEEIDKKIKKLEDLDKEYNKRIYNKKECIKKLEKSREDNLKNLLNNCWDIRDEFKVFSKIKLEKGTKKTHLEYIRKVLNNSDFNRGLSFEILYEEYNRLYEQDLQYIPQNINTNLYKKIRKIERKLNQFLSEVIVGNEDVDIAKLIKKLNSKSWVDIGRKYLEHTGSICPFCQKETIDDEFKKQLEEFFDETYQEKINAIKTLKVNYENLLNKLLDNLSQIQQNFNYNLCFNTYQELEKIKEKNIDIIEEKILNPNEKKTISSINICKDNLSNIIKKICENNSLFDSLDEHKQELKKKIWIYIANKCKNKIENYDKREVKYQRIVEKASFIIDSHKNKKDKIKENIEVLRKQTINTKEAVKNINEILKNSGFDNFRIEEEKIENNISRYYLKRFNSENTEVFQTLSEGEKNFISFLYFYQLCIGTDDLENNSYKKKIIVIDDPVSSLDSRVLFIISTLIRSLLKPKENNKREFKNENILQIFILTHNIYFYKEVAMQRRIINEKEINHYKISKLNNKSNIKKVEKPLFDDYSLMWKSLKDIKEKLPENKSMNIFIANTMRRIIESYVNFIGLGKNPWDSLSEDNINDPHYHIKSAFISIINDESHKIGALDNIYYQRIINEEPQVLFEVFEDIFNDIGREHYKMMMS